MTIGKGKHVAGAAGREMKLVECVPNFSEGRDKAKVDAIAAAAASVDGIRLLDVEMDKDHHRSVVTFIGPPEAAAEAAFRAAAKASELIDMRKHRGEHPRIGAADVIPFIPIAGVAMDDCIALARNLGQRIGRELDIPVYLYGRAASRPERRDLAAVRRGQFEGLRDAIATDSGRRPDYGPRRLHPTAGAVAVGARDQIVNLNVNLDLTDVEAGKAIAMKIRTSGGGLPELRAKVIRLSAGNIQISTVLTDYKKTSVMAVFEAIRREALARGATVVSSEIVGVVPRQALQDCAREALVLQGFKFDAQILEKQLHAPSPACGKGQWGGRASTDARSSKFSPQSGKGEYGSSWKQAAEVLTAALSSTEPTPGGGAAAAIAGAMGAGLAQMAVGISLRSKTLDLRGKPALEKLARQFARAHERFLTLGSEDAEAFEALMAVLKIPRDRPGRKAALEKALHRAAEVPMAASRLASEVRREAIDALPLSVASVASDMRCAAEFLRCAAYCAAENVRINTRSFSDKTAANAAEKKLKKILSTLG